MSVISALAPGYLACAKAVCTAMSDTMADAIIKPPTFIAAPCSSDLHYGDVVSESFSFVLAPHSYLEMSSAIFKAPA